MEDYKINKIIVNIVVLIRSYILVMMHIKGTVCTTTLQDYCSDLTHPQLCSNPPTTML